MIVTVIIDHGHEEVQHPHLREKFGGVTMISINIVSLMISISIISIITLPKRNGRCS